MDDPRPFMLIWTSANGQVTLERGQYGSIVEAAEDLPAAKARFHGEYPGRVDFHYPHDIEAGAWRVVPVQHEPRPRRRT